MKEKKVDKELLQKQRARSRINTKRRLRENALANSTSIADKKRYSEIMSNEYMSSKYSVSEEETGGELAEASSGEEADHIHSKTRKFAVMKLAWRSEEANKMMTTLDRKVERKRGAKGLRMAFERIRGNVSSRPTPLEAPAWAIKQ